MSKLKWAVRSHFLLLWILNMWTFCVDYLATSDVRAITDMKIAKIVGSKPIQVFDNPNHKYDNTSLVFRRAQFKAKTDKSFLKKLRRLSRGRFTITHVVQEKIK